MTKLLISLLGVGVLATAGWAAASGFDDADPARTVSLPATTGTGDDTTTQGTTTAATTTVEDEVENEVEDVSGPCDEAEHANDPRCTGGATTGDDDDGDDGDDDRSGANKGSDDDDDGGGDDDDDRSGSNSGKG